MNPEYLYPIQERHSLHRLKVHCKVSTGYGNTQFLGYATFPPTSIAGEKWLNQGRPLTETLKTLPRKSALSRVATAPKS